MKSFGCRISYTASALILKHKAKVAFLADKRIAASGEGGNPMLTSDVLVARVISAAERRKSDRLIVNNTVEEVIAELLAAAETNAELRRYLLRVGAVEAIVDEFQAGRYA
jgi:hypothetical protein